MNLPEDPTFATVPLCARKLRHRIHKRCTLQLLSGIRTTLDTRLFWRDGLIHIERGDPSVNVERMTDSCGNPTNLSWIYSLWPDVVAEDKNLSPQYRPEWFKHIRNLRVSRRLPTGARVCQGVVCESREGVPIAFEDVPLQSSSYWADFGGPSRIHITTKTEDIIASMITPPQVSKSGSLFRSTLTRGDVCSVQTKVAKGRVIRNCIVLAIRSSKESLSSKCVAIIATNVHFVDMDSDYNNGEGSWIIEIPSSYLIKDVPAYVDEKEQKIGDSFELLDVPQALSLLKSPGRHLKRRRDADISKVERALKKSCQFIHKELMEAKYHYNRSIREMEAHTKIVLQMEKLIRSYADGDS